MFLFKINRPVYICPIYYNGIQIDNSSIDLNKRKPLRFYNIMYISLNNNNINYRCKHIIDGGAVVVNNGADGSRCGL